MDDLPNVGDIWYSLDGQKREVCWAGKAPWPNRHALVRYRRDDQRRKRTITLASWNNWVRSHGSLVLVGGLSNDR